MSEDLGEIIKGLEADSARLIRRLDQANIKLQAHDRIVAKMEIEVLEAQETIADLRTMIGAYRAKAKL